MIQCGFFDSVNKDRLYKAEDMTRPYELLVGNGVFATPEGKPSDHLQVYADSGMNIAVKAGRGIFKDKWFINDSDLLLTVDTAEVTMTRIDAVVVRIDTSEKVRAGTIRIKKGTPSGAPKAPALERTSDVHEYRLANITVKPMVSQIEQANISDQRGSAECPWVTSLVQQVDTSTLFEQWEDAYEKYYAKVEKQYTENQSEFDALFAEMKATTGSIAMSVNTGYYTTKSNGETKVTVNVAYNSLVVYINGFHAVQGLDYTLSGNTITLTKGVLAGTVVSYVAFKQGSA